MARGVAKMTETIQMKMMMILVQDLLDSLFKGHMITLYLSTYHIRKNVKIETLLPVNSYSCQGENAHIETHVLHKWQNPAEEVRQVVP